MEIYDYLEFRHLRFIVTVANEGSMTKAAEKLNVVQSNLSKQISELEELFRVKLFIRGRGGVRLTEAGQSFYNYARQMLDMRAEAVNSFQALHDADSRPLRSGFSQFIERAIVETVIAGYRELFPTGNVIPEGGETNVLLKCVECGELDAALITLPFDVEHLCSQPLLHERMIVCLRKDDPLANQSELEAKDLDGRLGIFIDEHHHPVAHARLLEMLAEQSIRAKALSPAFSLEQIQWMVEQGMCLALIREHEMLHDALTARPIKGVTWTIDSAIIYRDKEAHGALALLLRHLSRQFPESALAPPKKPPQKVIQTPGLFSSGSVAEVA